MSARVDSIAPTRTVPVGPDGPAVLTNGRAVLDCGCQCVIGLRVDTLEVASVAGNCSPEHRPLIEDFQRRLVDSLDNPQSRPLVDVCVELLDEAEAAFTP